MESTSRVNCYCNEFVSFVSQGVVEVVRRESREKTRSTGRGEKTYPEKDLFVLITLVAVIPSTW